MLPRVSENKAIHRGCADVKLLCQLSLNFALCMALTDFSHTLVRKLGMTGFDAAPRPAFRNHIAQVYSLGAQEQMVWIETSRGIALMVHLLRARCEFDPVMPLIRKPMYKSLPPFNADDAIAGGQDTACPYPATCSWVDTAVLVHALIDVPFVATLGAVAGTELAFSRILQVSGIKLKLLATVSTDSVNHSHAQL